MTELTQSELVLYQAAAAVTQNLARPSAEAVVEALLQREKATRQHKHHYPFEQLQGMWRLCFITGTQKVNSRFGAFLGAGWYVPRWVKIQIAYDFSSKSDQAESEPLNLRPEQGQVNNSVELGWLQLAVTGPIKFLAPKNILAFDFTRLSVQALSQDLYQGYVRSGAARETGFDSDPVSKQAFFAYFWITEQVAAARGREGGLAIWSRVM